MRERGARATLAVVLLGACGASPRQAPTAAAIGGVDAHRVDVRIEFEPALLAPGELEVAHESGERIAVAAPCSGVDVRLLPGPVALVLRTGSRRHECALRVVPAMPAFVWRLVE